MRTMKKNVNINFSSDDAFLEYFSRGMLKIEILKNQKVCEFIK